MKGFPSDWTDAQILEELDHQLAEARERHAGKDRITSIEYRIAATEARISRRIQQRA